MSLKYRPEIDGLRAVAVSLVILFHAGVPGFSGGYLGVDVFFVISGFLITSIILPEMQKGTFSYANFVERRARRILPPLFVVMFSCIPFAYWLMLPDSLENFGQSLVATSFSANNILLWQTSGYWDLESEFKPLLHTWSLGVEEQFYLVYPIFLTLGIKFRKHLVYYLSIMGAISFIAMAYASQNDPVGSFYLIHFRAWQLILGGLAAILFADRRAVQRPAIALLGLALIFLAVIYSGISASSTVLGAVIATLGSSAILLHANGGGIANKILGQRPLVLIGLLSYSIYLWHQPVFAFARIIRFEAVSPAYLIATIPIIFGLSIFTWRFVERPFRNKSVVSQKQMLITAALCLTTLAGIGLALHLNNGAPQRLDGPPQVSKAGANIEYNERIRSRLPEDFRASRPGKKAILILGNSFARDFANVLIEAGLERSADLSYRDDISNCQKSWSEEDRALVGQADIVIFASGHYEPSCVMDIRRLIEGTGTTVLFTGPKNFGYNLNPLTRLSAEDRSMVRLMISPDIAEANARQSREMGKNYVDIMKILTTDGVKIRVADDEGRLLTTDRIHLSQAGARYIATRLPCQIRRSLAVTECNNGSSNLGMF